MNKREHKRFKVCGDINGKMVFPFDLEIIDISLTGIHFNCTNRLSINSRCMIQLFHEETQFIVNGIVVRSIYKGIKPSGEKTAEVYEIAMHFDSLGEYEQGYLNALIRQIENGQTL